VAQPVERVRSRRSAPIRLPSLLIDLAAGREPRWDDSWDASQLDVAADHRMTGLLCTWGRERLNDRELKTLLVMHDLGVRAHLDRVWTVLESVVSALEAASIEVATIKGVTTEARWYQRQGERPCSDVDLLLSPRQLDRAAETVSVLQPNHPWIPQLDRLVTSRRIQAVTLRVDNVDVDLHFDLLKLGIPTRGAHLLWDRTVSYRLPGGATVRVLDDTAALFHLLVHLNKDRFQRLLGYADIQRVIAGGGVDWELLLRDARREGIEVAVFRTLEVVLDELGIPWPSGVIRPRGVRAFLWGLLWHRGVRLRGFEGRLRYRMRQNWIAFLARGRGIEATRWWLREIWPPAVSVDLRYAEIRGPYAWKLFRGRLESARAHRARLAGLSRQSDASGQPQSE
jgi:hypothetical protein